MSGSKKGKKLTNEIKLNYCQLNWKMSYDSGEIKKNCYFKGFKMIFNFVLNGFLTFNYF